MRLSKVAKIIISVVLIMATVGAIAGVVAWTQSDKFDQKTLSYIGRYKIGGLDSNGNYSNVNTSIYTDDPFECQGLNCTLDFDATITYEIFFYDQNKDFVHTTGSLDKSFAEDSVPFFAKYARIVITPKDDNKITSLEKDKYAKQLNVKVNREQGYKNYTDDLVKMTYNHSCINATTGEIQHGEETLTTGVSDYIDIRAYKEALVFRTGPGTDLSNTGLAFYDAQKGFIAIRAIGSTAFEVFITSSGVKYYSINFSDLNLSNEPAFILVCCGWNGPVQIYCR